MPKIDKSYDIKKLHRYLLVVSETVYDKQERIVCRNKRHFIQWANLWNDLKRSVSSGWAVRYAASAYGLVMFVKTGNPLFLIFHGALTLDSATESNDTASFSVTVASNSNRMMIMGFGHYQSGNNISAATYNSDALTEIKAQAGSFGERSGLWGLVAPATGANTFAISGNDSWTGYGVLSIYDADQTLPATTAGFSGDSDGTTQSLTTTVDNAWVVAAVGAEPGITMDTVSGVEDMNEQGASYQNAEMHHVAKASAGSQSISFTLAYGGRWNLAMCQVKPYVAPDTGLAWISA